MQISVLLSQDRLVVWSQHVIVAAPRPSTPFERNYTDRKLRPRNLPHGSGSTRNGPDVAQSASPTTAAIAKCIAKRSQRRKRRGGSEGSHAGRGCRSIKTKNSQFGCRKRCASAPARQRAWSIGSSPDGRQGGRRRCLAGVKLKQQDGISKMSG
jgi:hypothetical protein